MSFIPIIRQSFYYYFILIDDAPETILEDFVFFREYGEWFFNRPKIEPPYFAMEYCNALLNRKGVNFNYTMVDQISKISFFKDFDTCFAFNHLQGMVAGDEVRYELDYSPIKIESLINDAHAFEKMVLDARSWTSIIKADPDYFFIKEGTSILLAGKDYLQVNGWLANYKIISSN